MNRRTNLILVITALALLALGVIAAHPCEVEGRIDAACMKGQP